MSQYFEIHPVNPQARLIRRAVEILEAGGIIVYPTDSSYALGCHLGDKGAMERIRRIRGVDERHHLTLVCRDLSELATYAKVDNSAYRLMKSLTPGPYTFILRATHEVPRRLQHPKRKTIGLRVPDHPVTQALLAQFGQPIMSTTLILPGSELPETDPQEVRARLEHDVDLILDAGGCGAHPPRWWTWSTAFPKWCARAAGTLRPWREPGSAFRFQPQSGYTAPMPIQSTIQTIAVAALPLLFAITVHEVAHGWVARRLGDSTAFMLGRLTLNPIKHIDPVGTILVPLVMLLLPGGFVFGWAKPVPVNFRNLHNPRRDMALVAVAGPMANLLMAFLWALVARAGVALAGVSAWAALPLALMGKFGILFNLLLMVLNLLPLPPLDGGRVVTGLLPGPMAWKFSRIEPYGFWILLALLVTGVLGNIIWPPVQMLSNLFFGLAGLPRF